jgi:hypothetical protein
MITIVSRGESAFFGPQVEKTMLPNMPNMPSTPSFCEMLCEAMLAATRPSVATVLGTADAANVCYGGRCYESDADAFGLVAPPRYGDAIADAAKLPSVVLHVALPAALLLLWRWRGAAPARPGPDGPDGLDAAAKKSAT